jgi:hypothetical protein
VAKLVTFAAVAQGFALFTKWRVGEGENIEVALGPMRTIPTEMPGIIFPGGTVLPAHIMNRNKRMSGPLRVSAATLNTLD